MDRQTDVRPSVCPRSSGLVRRQSAVEGGRQDLTDGLGLVGAAALIDPDAALLLVCVSGFKSQQVLP